MNQLHTRIVWMGMACLLGSTLLLADPMPPGIGDPANNPTIQFWAPPLIGVPGPPEPLPPGPIPASAHGNPYGEPEIVIGEGWEIEWVNPPGTEPGDPVEPIPTWHYNADLAGGVPTGTLTIVLPNSPEQNPIKHVWYSIISDKSPSDAARPIGVTVGYDPPVDPGDVNVSWDPAAWKSTQLGGGTPGGGAWYQYEGMATITPNPQWETLEFDILHCTNIAEIEVRTVCMPEPASLGLLAVGLVQLMRKRKR